MFSRPEAWIYQTQSEYLSYFLFSELNEGRTLTFVK